MSSIVIQVERLSKQYRLGTIGGRRLADDVNRWWARARKKADPTIKIGQEHTTRLHGQEFKALQDVSFEVNRGEILGIIGRNGAGKSTLLKILSRVTAPTSGEVRVKGRIASLLEVGTGFHPELTGRENIFLNGAILGMTKIEIKTKFDEIVAFSGVEDFVDTPVKRYSSGMYVRLAFAVAAHLEPEVLIVDEVLAVGDAEFQKKCLGKMKDVAGRGRTVLFVSHNLSAVRALCDRALVMRSGEVQFVGAVAKAIDHYADQNLLLTGETWSRPPSMHMPALAFEKVRTSLKGTQPQLRLDCDVKLRSRPEAPQVFIAVDICDSSLVPIMQALPSIEPFIQSLNGHCSLVLEIDLPPIVPGFYVLDFWIGTHFSKTIDYVKRVAKFEVLESPTKHRSVNHSSNHGFMVPVSRCRVNNATDTKL